MFSRIFIVGLSLAASLFSGCGTKQDEKAVESPFYPRLDSAIRPQDDFYRFVNNHTLALPVPATELFWSPVEEVRLATDLQLRQMLLGVETDGRYPEGTDQRKALRFFNLAADSAALTRLGVEAIRPLLNKINGLADEEDFIRLHDQLVALGVRGLWRWQMGPNQKMVFRPHFSGAGGKITDRQKAMVSVFENLGSSPVEAKKRAERLLNLEATLQNSVQSAPGRPYRAELLAWQKRSSINWQTAFYENPVDSIEVAHPPYFQFVSRWLSDKSRVEERADLLTWLLINQVAPLLSPEWRTRITGDTRPWWRHALYLTKQAFPDVFSRFYLSLSPYRQYRHDVEELVEHVGLALAEKIKESTHVPDSAKQIWLTKLSKVRLAAQPFRPFTSYADLAMVASAEATGLAGVWFNWIRKGHVETNPDSVFFLQPYEPMVVYRHDELFIPAVLMQPPWVAPAAGWNYGALAVLVSQELLSALQSEPFFQSGIHASDAFGLANALDVACRAALRYEMERFSGHAPPHYWNNFFTAFAFSQRASHRLDASVESQRAAHVYDALTSLELFYSHLNITENDRMWRHPRYRTPIW